MTARVIKHASAEILDLVTYCLPVLMLVFVNSVFVESTMREAVQKDDGQHNSLYQDFPKLSY